VRLSTVARTTPLFIHVEDELGLSNGLITFTAKVFDPGSRVDGLSGRIYSQNI
jgi:hypothetical protein